MTISEFAALSFLDCRAELWHGAIVRHRFRYEIEGVVAAKVMCAVANWAKVSRNGWATSSGTGFVIGEDSVLAPAGAFTSFERIEKYFGDRFLPANFYHLPPI